MIGCARADPRSCGRLEGAADGGGDIRVSGSHHFQEVSRGGRKAVSRLLVLECRCRRERHRVDQRVKPSDLICGCRIFWRPEKADRCVREAGSSLSTRSGLLGSWRRSVASRAAALHHAETGRSVPTRFAQRARDAQCISTRVEVFRKLVRGTLRTSPTCSMSVRHQHAEIADLRKGRFPPGRGSCATRSRTPPRRPS